MIHENKQVAYALKNAFNSLKSGKRLEARRWAEKAARLDTNKESPWLILAALAPPRASVNYLIRALEINPESVQARKGMHWAINRLRTEQQILVPDQTLPVKQPTTQETQKNSLNRIFPWAILLSTLVCASLILFGFPNFSHALNQRAPLALSGAALGKATRTPTPTPSFTPTSTFTSTPTATNTPTPTATFTPKPTSTPTSTPTFTPTFTPSPTFTSTPTNTPFSTNTTLFPPTQEPQPTPTVRPVNKPEGVKNNERWLDVDLSRQRLFAYKGNELVDKFIVSTGISKYPTVKGVFKVYVKYQYADMRGPGYHLEDVPYVMYFSGDYGIHGTYWHNNFGTPMSHGCVNLRTDDAKWLYNWAKVGTVVRVRR